MTYIFKSKRIQVDFQMYKCRPHRKMYTYLRQFGDATESVFISKSRRIFIKTKSVAPMHGINYSERGADLGSFLEGVISENCRGRGEMIYFQAF